MADDPIYPGEVTGGQLIEYYMRAKNMTVPELAELAGVQPAIIKRILTNKTTLLPAYIEDIFKVLGLRIVAVEETEEEEEDANWDD